jgi:indole-3-glycerol phosphate synthase / phosphoribosylanthranilate isomerase
VSVLEKIVKNRAARVSREGPSLGIPVPRKRELPLVPFDREPFLIAELKRKSPSRGNIDPLFNPVEKVASYRTGEAALTPKSLSVLTEEDFFGGSLEDLMAVKQAFPRLAVLRKDFLLSVEDIDVSYRAGADAVLLITRVLKEKTLREMHQQALSLGLTALIELHSEDDVKKVKSLKPRLVGINARNLSTFTVDPLHPVKLTSKISWETEVVYESGINGAECARFAGRAGFAGILVGETIVKAPERVSEIIKGFRLGKEEHKKDERKQKERGTKGFFWNELLRRVQSGIPLVKICGLTRKEDVLAADRAGADILGFILAPSPRRTTPDFLRSIPATDALKVAVLVGTEGVKELRISSLLEDGNIDAVQFHGKEDPAECAAAAFPYYKALSVEKPKDIERIGEFYSPRVLIDASYRGKSGGTGRLIDGTLVTEAGRRGPLWLAGGLGPKNIGNIIRAHNPELVDASSCLECKPGEKDVNLLREFIDIAKGRKK